ncbi:MAG: glycosyltransferase [Chitinivibrionales bacterium]|nr:glycosyltransferase [Chitinivibrionales bacterium]
MQMNILFVSNEYPPETGFGGIGTYTKCMAESLAGRGHSVHVLCRSASGAPYTARENGVEIHRISPGTYPLPKGKFLYHFRMLCYRLIPDSLIRLAWAAETYKTYCRLIRSGHTFDSIEFPECNGEGFYFVKNRVPGTIVRLHTPWEMARQLDRIKSKPIDAFVSAFIEKFSAQKANAISSPTQCLANKLEKEWSLKQIQVYPNPVAAHSFNKTNGHGIIYTGRIEHRKGVHVLVNAYAKLCEITDPPPLRLVGRQYGILPDGIEYGVLIENLINNKGVADRVVWIKGTDADGVREHLCASSIAVFPSLWENFPYTCLEAMSSGLCVVASRCGGFEEIIQDGTNGMLFSPGDEQELCNKLETCIRDLSLRETFGSEARKRISTLCNIDRICDKAEQVYHQTITGVSG